MEYQSKRKDAINMGEEVAGFVLSYGLTTLPIIGEGFSIMGGLIKATNLDTIATLKATLISVPIRVAGLSGIIAEAADIMPQTPQSNTLLTLSVLAYGVPTLGLYYLNYKQRNAKLKIPFFSDMKEPSNRT